jgi:DNA mismatch endonuclease (patch repair protein)
MTPRPRQTASPPRVAPETTARMKAVRQRDTSPERAVRSLLFRLGVRYRICPRDLPGRPDIVNKSRRWCIFVHGCFWHGHESCALARLPRTNRSWWASKIAANRMRDARKEEGMRSLGFRIAVVWQCELRDERQLTRRLAALVAQDRS